MLSITGLKALISALQKIGRRTQRNESSNIILDTFPLDFSGKRTSEKFINPAINELFRRDFEYHEEQLKCGHQKIKVKLEDSEVNVEGRNGFFPNNLKGFRPESTAREGEPTTTLDTTKSGQAIHT